MEDDGGEVNLKNCPLATLRQMFGEGFFVFKKFSFPISFYISSRKMKLSRHAKNRLRKFELSLPSIQECIDAPDFIEDEIKGGKNAWKKFDDRFIKVTFATKASEHIIITVTLKEKPPKEFTQ